MDEQQKEIVKKVQKLLRLAENAGSEDEARNAMLRIREILDKYNLSLGDVESFSEEECGEASYTIKGRHVPAHVKSLVSAAAMLCDARAVFRLRFGNNRNRQRITFAGVGADGVVAAQTFAWLLEFAKRRARERKLSGRSRSDYLIGFANSVLCRAFELKDKPETESASSGALVPLKNAAVAAYMDRHYHTDSSIAPPRKREFSQEMAAGIYDGRQVSLNRQVEGCSYDKAIE